MLNNNLRNLSFMLWCLITFLFNYNPMQAQSGEYPSAQISNQHVVMKLYLPDPEIGYYRATRFDWSGIIYSLEFKSHQYFGEWKDTHDPLVHEDITGPVESYNSPGLGYENAEPGEEFIRIGVGRIEKIQEQEYEWSKTYKIIDHGTWTVNQGKDWIEFRHELKNKDGWGYIYTKRIDLMKETPGFSIHHTLKNTGLKTIETDQYNHNFFVIDNKITGPDFQVEFPFNISTENDLKGVVKIDRNKLLFDKMLSEGFVWLELKGYEETVEDHQIEIVNKETGAGVRLHVDRPLHRLVFWATNTTLCPENFIYLNLESGEEETWISNYELFSDEK